MLMLPVLIAAAATGAAVPAGTPAPGRYDAQMCVTLNANPPTCGPLEARVDSDGTLTLRADDIRYILSFEQGLLVGITMHGGMQIAEFLSSYRWAGGTLMFGDRARSAQYEIKLAPAAGAASAASR
jgi:hypothetical protein